MNCEDLAQLKIRTSYLEAGLVDVVTTSSLAVHYLLRIRGKIQEAYWTVAFDGFSIGVCSFAGDTGGSLRGWKRCRSKDFPKLVGKKSKLILQVFRCFENIVEHLSWGRVSAILK